MKIFLGIVVLGLLWCNTLFGESSLPPCQGEHGTQWTNCFGTMTSADGRKYVGEWKDQLPNGQGTITYTDGHKYVGEWKDGKYHGQGTFTFPDGTKEVGEFKNGEFYAGETIESESEKKEKSKTGSSGLGKYNTSAWGVAQGAGSEFEARDLLLFSTECVKSSSYAVQEALSAYHEQASNLFYQKNYNGAIRAFKDLMNLGRSNGARNCDLHLQDRFRN